MERQNQGYLRSVTNLFPRFSSGFKQSSIACLKFYEGTGEHRGSLLPSSIMSHTPVKFLIVRQISRHFLFVLWWNGKETRFIFQDPVGSCMKTKNRWQSKHKMKPPPKVIACQKFESSTKHKGKFHFQQKEEQKHSTNNKTLKGEKVEVKLTWQLVSHPLNIYI